MEKELAFELYQKIGNLNYHTVDEKWFKRISEIEDIDYFIDFNMNNYDSRYVISLLLTFSSTTFQLSSKNWVNIIKLSWPKPKIENKDVFKKINDDGIFTDMIFFIKYLEIDIFKILFNNYKNDLENLNQCIIFFEKYKFKFERDDDFKSELIELYNIDLKRLRRYSLKLRSEFKRNGIVFE